MNEQLVSFIVPVYNAARTLEACIKSIKKQTYPQIEILLINDGSTDGSGDLCEAFAAEDRRIRVFHQANKGPATARNTGIHHAIGTYIQFVDADDTILPPMTRTLVSHMSEEIDLVICGYEANDVQQHKRRTKNVLPSIQGTFTHDAFIDQIGILYHETIFPSPCNKLYKADVILAEQVRFMDDFHMGEDVIFNIDYIEVCRNVSVVSEPLYTYVIREQESLSTRFHQHYVHYQWHIHHHLTEFLQRKNKLSGANAMYIQMMFMKSVINSFTHLFHPGNPEHTDDKKKRIQTIVSDPNVRSHLHDLRGSLQARIVRRLIQKQSVHGIYSFFHTKRMIQTYVRPLYQLLKRLDAT